MHESYVLSIVRVGMLGNMQSVQAKGKRLAKSAKGTKQSRKLQFESKQRSKMRIRRRIYQCPRRWVVGKGMSLLLIIILLLLFR